MWVASCSKSIHFASSGDRKSTRLNSSHGYTSYAVFCLNKKMLTATLRRFLLLVLVEVDRNLAGGLRSVESELIKETGTFKRTTNEAKEGDQQAALQAY